ncbi:Protein of unknown function [Gryllus bimaculatus]|nr:Protein of unknown function [Gryllus bimaculatus]
MLQRTRENGRISANKKAEEQIGSAAFIMLSCCEVLCCMEQRLHYVSVCATDWQFF